MKNFFDSVLLQAPIRSTYVFIMAYQLIVIIRTPPTSNPPLHQIQILKNWIPKYTYLKLEENKKIKLIIWLPGMSKGGYLRGGLRNKKKDQRRTESHHLSGASSLNCLSIEFTLYHSFAVFFHKFIPFLVKHNHYFYFISIYWCVRVL